MYCSSLLFFRRAIQSFFPFFFFRKGERSCRRAKSYNPVNNCVEGYGRRHRALGVLRVFPVREAVATALERERVCVCMPVCVYTTTYTHTRIGGNRRMCASAIIPRGFSFIFILYFCTTRRLPTHACTLPLARLCARTHMRGPWRRPPRAPPRGSCTGVAR